MEYVYILFEMAVYNIFLLKGSMYIYFSLDLNIKRASMYVILKRSPEHIFVSSPKYVEYIVFWGKEYNVRKCLYTLFWKL